MKTTVKPTLQIFHMEGVKHIHPADALEALQNGNAVMIDVRELNEVQLERIPLDRVINHPMSVIMDRLPYIAKDQQIIVACPGGVRSVKVANWLIIEGYPNVASLDGGLTMWKEKGLPFDNNPSLEKWDCKSGTPSNTGHKTSAAAPIKNSIIGIRYYKC